MRLHQTMPTKQARRFCFTYYSEIEPQFNEEEMHFLIWGRETCPTTGRVHFQSYVEFKKLKSYTAVRRDFFPGLATSALFVARGTAEENITYCSKDGNFQMFGEPSRQGARNDLVIIKNRIQNGESLDDLMGDDDCCEVIARHMAYFKEIYNKYRAGVGLSVLKDRLAGATLKVWQQRLVDIAGTDPDSRHVYWFWESVGGTGKTFIGNYLSAFHGAIVFTSGKVADIAHAYKLEPIVIFDLSRTQEDKLDAVYMVIENFKNGRMFSPKYDSHVKVFAVPHVIVFANYPPDKTKLSADRWKIHHIQ